MHLIEKIKLWYRGKYIPPPPNDPNSSLVFVSPGHYEQPFLAKLFGALGRFWLAHWQWVIGTTIALAAIFLKLAGGSK